VERVLFPQGRTTLSLNCLEDELREGMCQRLHGVTESWQRPAL
jgi:hypothetical protein